MYITNVKKLGVQLFPQDSAGFVDYLVRKTRGEQEEHGTFFSINTRRNSAEEVVRKSTGNTAKLEKTEPGFIPYREPIQIWT